MEFICCRELIMRVSFIPPTSDHYDQLFNPHLNQRGYGINDIRVYKRRGGSIFGFIRTLAKSALPFVKNLILPEIGNFAKNVTHDVANNVPFKRSMKRNILSSSKNIGSRIIGAGKKKKNGGKKKIVKKKPKKTLKRCKNDIFSYGKFEI